MLRPKDCIYCPNPTGSREHIFPAALGGRRTNKSILCQPCDNGELATLVRHLAAQLHYLRGVLGVRPDHKDAPVPAAVPHGGNTILIDGYGRPSYKDPETLADEPLENGSRRVRTAFANERQVEAWRAEQRRKGLTVKDEDMSRVARFMPPLQFEWQFGGEETFRAAAAIALNFLAHRFPTEARDSRLRPLKDYIQGKRTLTAGEDRHAWHHIDQVPVPASTVELGHQVFLRVDRERGTGYAVVRFFEAVEIVVDFGALSPAATRAILFNIDPHADHPPNDLFEVECAPEDFPISVTLLKIGDERGAAMSDRKQLMRALDAVEERQRRLRLTPLVAKLEDIRATPSHRWSRAIHAALEEHQGSIYHLVKYVVSSLKEHLAAHPEMTGHGIEECLTMFAEPDPASPRGITRFAYVVVKATQGELASVFASELADGPVSLERTILLLEGTPGAAIVRRYVAEQVAEALKRTMSEPVSAQP